MQLTRTKTFNKVSVPHLSTKLPVREESGKRYYKLPNDEWVPSITTVLGHFKKHNIMKWRNRVGAEEANKVSSRAATRGTKIHKMVEKYIANYSMQTITENVPLPNLATFKDLQPVLDRIDNVWHQELSLFSNRIKLAGTVDLIAEFEGKLSVIDFKTSTKWKRKEWITDYFEQATAYKLMYECMTGVVIDQIVVIIVSDDSVDPQIFVENPQDYEEGLMSKLIEYRKEVVCAPSIIS